MSKNKAKKSGLEEAIDAKERWRRENEPTVAERIDRLIYAGRITDVTYGDLRELAKILKQHIRETKGK